MLLECQDPSMMLQYGVSFDTYYGRVIDTLCNPIIDYLRRMLQQNMSYDQEPIHSNILESVKRYVDWLKPQNKNDYKVAMYYIIMNCLFKLKQSGATLDALMNPIDQRHYILLKLYLLPFLDLIAEIHKDSQEYNIFCHDYILNNQLPSKLSTLYIISNEMEPTIKIETIQPSAFENYIKNLDLSTNIAGTLFYHKSKKNGIGCQFLEDALSRRKDFKTKRGEYTPGTPEYNFYDLRQIVAKINANSSYGLMGMAGFRFSNKQLAKTVTVNGRLALKTAQMCGEIFLRNTVNPPT